MWWQVLVAILATLWFTTLVGAVILARSRNEVVTQLTKYLDSQRTEIMRLQTSLREACDKLSSMHRQGFVTLPNDDSFDTYTITPEFEAEVEAARRGEDRQLRDELRRSLFE